VKTFISVAGILLSSAAFADRDFDEVASHVDYATVLNSTPITRTIRVSEPHQRCWNEEVTRVERGRSDPGATIVGGLIGAAIGNHLGRHAGSRGAGTVAGAVIGGSIGHEASRGRDREYADVERRCETSHNSYNEDRVVGYRVVYRYNGETYETRMASEPGKKIRVRVTVEPMPE
jgi:uncharacterized protein YcfJ